MSDLKDDVQAALELLAETHPDQMFLVCASKGDGGDRAKVVVRAFPGKVRRPNVSWLMDQVRGLLGDVTLFHSELPPPPNYPGRDEEMAALRKERDTYLRQRTELEDEVTVLTYALGNAKLAAGMPDEEGPDEDMQYALGAEIIALRKENEDMQAENAALSDANTALTHELEAAINPLAEEQLDAMKVARE